MRATCQTDEAPIPAPACRHTPRYVRFALFGSLLALCACAGTTGGSATTQETPSSDSQRRYPLKSLPTTTVTINGHVIRAWLAQDFDPNRPGVTQEGLMRVYAEEIADDQGMLFVFYDERVRSFWMFNTITPLEVAFARFNGTIVRIHQMPPLTLQSFSSVEPALFALEVKQGTFAQLGIKEGDKMIIPDAALRVAP